MADVLDIHEGDDEFQVDEEGDSELLYELPLVFLCSFSRWTDNK